MRSLAVFPCEKSSDSTSIIAANCAAANSINRKRSVHSALKFLLAGMALVVIVGLGAILYSLYRGGQETEPATVRPQADQQQGDTQQKSAAEFASAQCPTSTPSSGYVSGKYVYRLSKEVFPASASLEKEIGPPLRKRCRTRGLERSEGDPGQRGRHSKVHRGHGYPASKHELQLR